MHLLSEQPDSQRPSSFLSVFTSHCRGGFGLELGEMQSPESPSPTFLLPHEVRRDQQLSLAFYPHQLPRHFLPGGAGKGVLFCSLAFECPGLPRGGFLPALAMAPPQGLVLAAGVVGSEHHRLGIGEPAHGERRDIISAIPTQSREWSSWLAGPLGSLASAGSAHRGRRFTRRGGAWVGVAAPVQWGGGDSARAPPRDRPRPRGRVRGGVGAPSCPLPQVILIWCNCQVAAASRPCKHKSSWLGNNELPQSLFFFFPFLNSCFHLIISATSCNTKWSEVKWLSPIRLFATPLDCSLPDSSVHGIFQARALECRLPFPPPGNLPDPGIEPRSPAL